MLLLQDFLKKQKLSFQPNMLLGERAAKQYDSYVASKKQGTEEESGFVTLVFSAIESEYELQRKCIATGESWIAVCRGGSPDVSWSVLFDATTIKAKDCLRRLRGLTRDVDDLRQYVLAAAAARTADRVQSGLADQLAVTPPLDRDEFLGLLRRPKVAREKRFYGSREM